MTDKLCDKLLNGKEQHRDIASIALKTIIVEVTTASLSEKILVSLSPQLIIGVTSGKSAEIKCECLDILGDVLHRFGNVITKDHAFMLTALLTQLSSTQASVRKKSVTCIASLAPCLSDDLLAKATSEVVQLLKNKRAKSEITRTNIQMIGALSESANEYTDDEDASWKVRRASAKCLSAIIVSRPQMLSKMYQEACPKLIDRFREREENVKCTEPVLSFVLLCSPRWLLKQEVPKVVKSINRQLREKSIKTKDKSSTSNLKIEALAFTRIVMASHSPSVFHPYIQALSGPILSAIGDRYYKVTAEALRVCGELVRVLRPNFEARSIDFRPYISPIYKAILGRLANQDQDQEVKECAISCMSLVIATFGDGLQSELPSCLPILVDRMGNEITRLTAVKL
uniref:TATA-binding protein interacting (TIP20) domain-containing protein n=1 Tax=Aegilops tauschii subsp. strangulata TaxID=200361 RepID=A0A453JP11_AEGTS